VRRWLLRWLVAAILGLLVAAIASGVGSAAVSVNGLRQAAGANDVGVTLQAPEPWLGGPHSSDPTVRVSGRNIAVARVSSATEDTGAAVEAAVHGNSAASTATSYLYRLTDSESGDLLKWGISKNPGSRYAQGFLQDKSMELMTSGTRREMLDLERFIVERDPGPLNREPWAGSQANDVPGGP
jgi:hypothetical protein